MDYEAASADEPATCPKTWAVEDWLCAPISTEIIKAVSKPKKTEAVPYRSFDHIPAPFLARASLSYTRRSTPNIAFEIGNQPTKRWQLAAQWTPKSCWMLSLSFIPQLRSWHDFC